MNSISFEEILEKEGRLIYSNKGGSMKPLIREGRDLMVIGRKQGRLRKYDVPLYRRDSGQYVLHRVMKVREDGYVMCGDNRWRVETGVTDRQILGVLTAVIRDGKELPVTDKRYRLYVFFWCGLFPLRAFALKGLNALKRMKKK